MNNETDRYSRKYEGGQMKITKNFLLKLDTYLFLYLPDHDMSLSQVNALDFRNWCYAKEREHSQIKKKAKVEA